MSDDQDGCERVNVSSGTGLPGLSRTNGRSTVVVVVTISISVYKRQIYQVVCVCIPRK